MRTLKLTGFCIAMSLSVTFAGGCAMLDSNLHSLQSSGTKIEGLAVDKHQTAIHQADVHLVQTQILGQQANLKTLASYTTQTDETGYFSFDAVDPGVYSVLVRDQDGKQASKTHIQVLESDPTIDIGILTLNLKGSISGTVLLDDQTAYHGIDVYIPGTSYLAKTDLNGVFTIRQVPEGDYQLTAIKTGYIGQTVPTVSVVAGEAALIATMNLFPDPLANTPTTVTGNQGEKGDQGATGNVGEKGDTGETGIKGDQGEKGDQGVTGNAGADGNVWFSGTSSPNAGLGAVNGDFYFNTSTGEIYNYLSDTWVLISTVKGANGTNGQNGANGATGAQGPTGATGARAPVFVPTVNITSLTFDHDTQLVTLSVTTSTDSGIHGYRLFYSSDEFDFVDENNFLSANLMTSLNGQVIANNITPSTTYYIRAAVMDTAGNVGYLSPAVTLNYSSWIATSVNSGSIPTPRSLGVDTNGLVYVANQGGIRVSRFDPADFDGTLTHYGSFGPLVQPKSAAVDTTNTLVFVADIGLHKIVRFDPTDFDGTDTAFGASGSGSGKFSSPNDTFFDNTSGLVYVADTGNHRIVQFDPADFAGTFTSWGSSGSGSGNFSSPSGVFVTSTHVYVADTGNDRIVRFQTSDFAGSFESFGAQSTSATAVGFSEPYDVAVDDTYVYVSDETNDRLARFKTSDYSGTFRYISSFGSSDSLNNPQGLHIVGSTLYISDSNNGRVKIAPLQTGSTTVP